MDFWIAERESVQHRISEIENTITGQQNGEEFATSPKRTGSVGG
jgi:hypothetical protein